MFSKCLEVCGLGLIAWGLALYLSAPAGIIFAGASILFVGGVTDDAAVGQAFRRGFAWTRYAWQRQVLRESGIQIPNLRRPRLPEGWVPCECGRDEDCPVCEGLGFVPDPEYQENRNSPHPKIKVDPQAQAFWSRMADARRERSRTMHDRTPALSRHDEDRERIA